MAGVFFAPWTQAPDYLGASESGARLGLSQQEMQRQSDQHAAELALRADELSARMGQAAAERDQQQKQFDAGNALRTAALQQQGMLGTQRNQNIADRITAAQALQKSRQDFLERNSNLNRNFETQKLTDAEAKEKDEQGRFDTANSEKQKTASDTAGAAALLSSWTPQSNVPPPTVQDALQRFQNASASVLERFKAPAGGSASPMDASRRRLAADYILKQNEGTPTNSVDNVVSQYDKLFPTGAAAPQAAPAAPGAPAGDALTPPAPTAASVDGLPDPAAAPVTATNPKTGEKMALINGQWQSIPPQQ